MFCVFLFCFFHGNSHTEHVQPVKKEKVKTEKNSDSYNDDNNNIFHKYPYIYKLLYGLYNYPNKEFYCGKLC